MNTSVRILQVDKAFVLEKCGRFVDFQLWRLQSELDPEGWLGNFTAQEQEHAYHLLNSFLFFSNDLVRAMFLAAFQNISCLVRHPGRQFDLEQAFWRTFCNQIIITYVTGEIPNPTDSGFIFARMARQYLGIPQERIIDPREALQLLVQGANKPVVFVDDFVGSGQQFISTWKRLHNVGLPSGGHYSFEMIAKSKGGSFFYTPVISTIFGVAEIGRHCPEVQLSPANVLSARYSALHADSLVWPAKLLATGPAFVEGASKRAGIPDTSGNKNDWRGFARQGLCVAFEHSVPDATLPIFYWEKNGWNPLVRRR
jgi:hypothetical protein